MHSARMANGITRPLCSMLGEKVLPRWTIHSHTNSTMRASPSSILMSSVRSLSYNFPFLPYSLNIEENNKYLEPASSTLSSLALAKQMLEQNASLSEVALLLEAAIQKGELGEGGYEAWILLGETRNMDEREEAGMKALTEGVRLAEEAGAAGAGMLVCYSHNSSTGVFL